MLNKTLSLPTFKVKCFFFLQASLLVRAVEACVSPRKEQPIGLIGAFLKVVYNYRWVV